MKPEESNLQFFFKEFIRSELPSKGIKKTRSAYQQGRKIPDHVCDLFVYEPKNIEEAQLGTLFMLGKIKNIPKNKYRNLDFLLSLLISVIKREFYSDSKRSTIEALEASLNKANLYLTDFTEKGNTEWINNLDFICGVFVKNLLHVTQIGEPIIKLFRETTISHIENKFPERKRINPLKTFGNIASGTISPGDKIIMGLKDMLDIIPLKRFKDLSKKNCNQIVEEIKILIEENVSNIPIVCLVFEAKTGSKKTIIHTSIKKTISREYLTSKQSKSKIIAKKTWIISKKISIVTFLIIYRLIYLLFFTSKKLYKFVTPVLKKISKTGLPRRVKAGFYKLIIPLFLKTKKIASKIAKKNKLDHKYDNLKKRIKSITIYKIKNLYNKNKPAFFVTSILILLILILPFSIVYKINYYTKMTGFKKLSAEIEETQRKTDSALVYQNKEKARALLQKNEALITNLTTYIEKSSIRKKSLVSNNINILQRKHRDQQDSINNVKRIEYLKEVFDFSTSGFIVNPVEINKIKDTLYFYELDSGILYKFSIGDETGLVLIFISSKDELRKMSSLDNGKIVLFGQSNKIYLYDSNTNEHKTYTLDPNIEIENVLDVKNFLSSFYILDTNKNNIIKYSARVGNIIHGANWLAAPLEKPKDIQSMAIDGSIYILDSRGIISRYFQGKKVEEIQSKLDKPLKGKNKIFIKDDFANFYISDPQNKRLIVLNKQGEIINQYINDEFINLQDFWVTNDEKEVYLLSDKKVFKLEF